LYSGQQLADEQNVVVVVGQYRVGQLGYLALPEMGDAAGSLATLDQVAVLRWIGRNIAQFGGDRTNVTVTGQSAGASSVCAMLTTPLAKNLFSRAIIQSGSCNQLTGTPIETATTNSALFVKAIGCDVAADTLACLRSKGSIDFLRAAAGTPSNRQATGTTVLPKVMATAIAEGDWNKVPVMIGNTLTEAKLFMPPEQTGDMTDAEYESLVRQQYPTKAEAVLDLYPASKFGGGFYALAQIGSESWVCSSLRMATTFSGQTKTFSYIFDDPTSPIYYGYTRPNTDMSNAHGTDLKYVYDLTIVEQDLTRKQAETAKRIRGYWGAFAWSGDPGAAGRSQWPAVTPSKLSTKILGPQEKVITDAFAQHNCDFWAQP
jgi:para-nitrobenzyl esterase